MNKRVFIQYISESNFKELFIREMGWNNPKGQTVFDITIEDIVYEFQQIADRSGFQVLTCCVKDIPSASLCKKMDTKLRKQANDYICIRRWIPSYVSKPMITFAFTIYTPLSLERGRGRGFITFGWCL